MIIWIRGVSGVGKTTLSKKLFQIYKAKNKNTVLIDGDKFRKLFKNDLKFSLKDRNRNAERLIAFVKFLDNQKINVILAANLTSVKYRVWCKKNFKNYIEILINTKINNLIKRDKKNIYNSKNRKNVVGQDIPNFSSKTSDLIINNDSSKKEFFQKIKLIQRLIKSKKKY